MGQCDAGSRRPGGAIRAWAIRVICAVGSVAPQRAQAQGNVSDVGRRSMRMRTNQRTNRRDAPNHLAAVALTTTDAANALATNTAPDATAVSATYGNAPLIGGQMIDSTAQPALRATTVTDAAWMTDVDARIASAALADTRTRWNPRRLT